MAKFNRWHLLNLVVVLLLGFLVGAWVVLFLKSEPRFESSIEITETLGEFNPTSHKEQVGEVSQLSVEIPRNVEEARFTILVKARSQFFNISTPVGFVWRNGELFRVDDMTPSFNGVDIAFRRSRESEISVYVIANERSYVGDKNWQRFDVLVTQESQNAGNRH